MDKSTGCGAGSLLVKKNSILSTTTRATVDGSVTSGMTRYFGTTTGTSGCAQHSIVKGEERPLLFAKINYEILRKEISLGSGPFLHGLASSLGCPAKSLPSFAKELRKNYQVLFPFNSANETSQKFISNIKSIMKTNHSLVNSCNVKA